MLSALIQLVLTPWTLATIYLSRLWGYLFYFTHVPRVRTCEINTSNINEAEVKTLGSNAQEFPATEE